MFWSKIINAIIIIVISYILIKLIDYLLHKLFEVTKFDVRYENTMCSVLSSVSYYIIFTIVAYTIYTTIRNCYPF